MARAAAFNNWNPASGRGFLPAQDPLERLPSAFDAWEHAAENLPKYLAAGEARRVLAELPELDTQNICAAPEIERAMLLLSYFGHAYVWGDSEAASQLPAQLARPWQAVAARLERPPVLSYASYALFNWRRLDSAGPIALGNLALLQNFFGGLDEEWFILVHIEIEAKAADTLLAMSNAQAATSKNDKAELARALQDLSKALESMHATLARMPQGCDPYIYYRRVRPYIHAWKSNPALPDGLIYQGVATYHDQPQKFRGETGAQSSIMPALDAFLGIDHSDDPLRPYLLEMRDYMPAAHRAYLQKLESTAATRQYVLKHKNECSLVEPYNSCVLWVQRFRALHLDFAANYINRQAQIGPSNPVETGTGGTPFMAYLRKHRDETGQHLID